MIHLHLDIIKKYLYIIGGTLFLAIGIVGIFVPVLPTTPFLLLTAFCYMRGSKRLYVWLITHKIFGAYIYSYLTYKAVSRKTKIIAITFLWVMLCISAFFVPFLHVRLFLLAVGIGVTIHLGSLKTIDYADLKEMDDLQLP